MEIAITIGSVTKNILCVSDELSTIVDLTKGKAGAVRAFRELLEVWLSAKNYEFEDFQNYGKR